MKSPIVFFDIAGQEDERLKSFYSKVFGWTFDEGGECEVSVTSPLNGAIRKDPAEKRIYLGVSNVSESLEQIKAEGGSIDTPRFEVPGLVILGLFRDPAGNEMGLVEMEGDEPKIP